MKTKLATTCLVIATLMAPIVSFAEDADADRSNPKAFVKDSAITTKIKSRLAAENIASLANISVDTDANGAVWLSGTVRSKGEADKAVAIARDTENVRSVRSELTIKKDD